MIKVLVVSDSHGDVDNMCLAVDLEQPQLVLHLGDGWRDADLLAERYPDLPIEKVAGNCDYHVYEPTVRLLLIGGRRVMMCHGHTLGVKTDIAIVLREAQRLKADVALFGHTHKTFDDIRAGIVLHNPGSIGSRARPTYGILTFEDGVCRTSLHNL